MEIVTLGSTGLRVSRFGLGTATFGGQCDDRTSFEILDHAASLGINFLDTADKYPLGTTWEMAGKTEEIVGTWLRGRRDDFVVATKVHGPTGPNPWDRGLSRRHITQAVNDSLRRLQTDVIDLYQLHRPDPETPIEETLETLSDLVRMGKVRYVGCSNYLAYQVARALGRSDTHGYAHFVSVQARYNLVFREHERELLPLCREEGLALLVYNLLAGGLLTGKHDSTSGPMRGSRFATTGASALYQSRYWDDRRLAAVNEMQNVADDLGIPLVTLATAWVLDHPVAPLPLLGATKPGHLDAPVAGHDVSLSVEVRSRLDEITDEFRRGDAVQ